MSDVTLLDVMGNDNSIVNAARVSFNKEHSAYTTEQNTGLLNYLAKHKHWSPFAHTCLQFRLGAPVFVARQLAKHQVGLSWNEVSRRYVNKVPEIWFPVTGWRKAAADKKQGSSDETISSSYLDTLYNNTVILAVETYEQLLDSGVCPEQARSVLPQGMITEWIWTGSLYAFHRIVKLRSHPTAQNETKDIVKQISNYCLEKFPVAWTALNTYDM